MRLQYLPPFALVIGCLLISQAPLALGQSDQTTGAVESAVAPEPKVAEAAVVADFPVQGPLFDEYRNVAKDLRCPTCTGLSVLESEAKFSEQIKSIVKEQVQAGKSKDEILKYFTERYGPWILRAPPKEGFNVLAWGFPLVLLLGGPPVVWALVWRRRRLVSTLGVRTAEDILQEMHASLEQHRSRRPEGHATVRETQS